MVTITFLPSGKTLQVAPRTNLMAAITSANLPLGASCGGQGICTKCLVKVVKGEENLTKPNILEKKLKIRDPFPDNMRVSCQTKILDDVTITATYW